MLARPMPKNAKIGVLGLLVVILVAAVLLPMAKSDEISESRKIRSLVGILQQNNNQKRGSAAEDLAEIIENEAITDVSANKALRAITSRIKKHPKTMDRRRRFDSYPNVFWEEIGLAFELILSRKIEQNDAIDFLQAVELVGCTYGEEGENVFRLFGQLSIPRKDIVVNYRVNAAGVDLLDVYIPVGGDHSWGRETEIQFEPDGRSLLVQLKAIWYQIPESSLRSLPPSWDDKDKVLKKIVQSASAKKLCGYTKTLSLSQESDRQGIFGQDSPNSQSNREEGQFKIKFPNGVTVELFGVCEHPSAGKQWWRPDGRFMDEAPYKTMGSRLKHHEGYSDYEFAMRLTGSSDISYECLVPGSRQSTDTGIPIAEDGSRVSDLRVYTANQPEDRKSTSMRIGVTAAKWDTAATVTPAGGEQTFSLAQGAVAFGAPYERDGDTFLPVVRNFSIAEYTSAIRVIAVSKLGGQIGSSVSGRGGNILSSLTYSFDLPMGEVREFRFQTRPYQWIEFKNVSLRPGLKTDVGIMQPREDSSSAINTRREEKVFGIGPAWQELKSAVGDILQRPLVRRQHEIAELLLIRTGEAAYDIGQSTPRVR